MYVSDDIVRSRDAVVRFPGTDSPDFATAGKAKRMSLLAGASVVSDETFGKGRVVSFSIDPNFRAWTLGTDRMLWNALTGPDPRSTGSRMSRAERAAAVDRAQRAERRVEDVGDAIRVAIPRSDSSTAQRVIRAIGLRPSTARLGNEKRLLVVPNVEYRGLEESRKLSLVLPRLEAAGVTILWASLPGP
jgi:hypothetical protein